MTIETAQPTPTDHPGMVRNPPKSTVALALLSIGALSFLIENQSAVSQSPSSLQIRPSDGPASKTEFDRHAEEQKFRALRMMDENGQIPPDGLWLALEHRRKKKFGEFRERHNIELDHFQLLIDVRVFKISVDAEPGIVH